eukprot:SM000001S04435  [mRNA]  locus=s1:176046:176337:+ [translate_table: standard]
METFCSSAALGLPLSMQSGVCYIPIMTSIVAKARILKILQEAAQGGSTSSSSDARHASYFSVTTVGGETCQEDEDAFRCQGHKSAKEWRR